jgi:hypothetical protein
MYEVLERHFAVLNVLVGHNERADLLVIGTDYGPNDLFGGWTKRHLPGAWPWHKWSAIDDPEAVYYFWVSYAGAVRDLGPLLEKVAEDVAKIQICDADLEWMYRPYDGGADVFARTTEERDLLHARFAGWLPSGEDGL